LHGASSIDENPRSVSGRQLRREAHTRAPCASSGRAHTKTTAQLPARLALAAAVVAASILAGAGGAAGPSPKSLALKLSDFPPGTRAGLAYPLAGPTADLYTEAFNIRPGDPEHEEDVSLSLWVAKDMASARAVYRDQVGSYAGKGPHLGAPPGTFDSEVVLSLPSYGDEQYADYFAKKSRPHGQLFVRRGNIVWYLTVENCTINAPSCYGTSRDEAPIGKAEAAAELERYAAKLRRRIG
jgi:hypothetical protein